MSDARERAYEALENYGPTLSATSVFSVLDDLGLRIVDAEPEPTPHVRPNELHDGGMFYVRDVAIGETWGAWMVHLPTGLGVAHAEHRSLLQNRVACVREISDKVKGVTT